MAKKDFSQYSDEELLQIIGQKQPSLIEKAGNVAEKFNNFIEGTRLPAFAGGLLQGVGDIGASLGNVVANPLGYEIPHPNLGQYIDNSLLSRLAFGAGEISSQIPLYSSGAGLIGKTTGIGTKAGLSGKSLQGAISGALLGESDEGDRLLGAATGAALPIAGQAIEKISQLRSKNIASNVINSMKNTEKKYSNQFNHIIQEAENRGYAGNYNPIKFDKELLQKGGNSKLVYALKQYNKKPSLEAAHEVQSDLGKFVYSIGRPADSIERKAKEEAKEISEALRKHIITQLNRSGNPDLALNYINARHGYKSEFVPYLKSKSVQKLLKDELTPRDFAKAIAQEKKFKAKIGRYSHPEIQQRELIRKLATSKAGQYAIGSATGTILGGAGLYGLSKLFK
ncbi:hypothetical protein [Legionella micdadei]|uniref:Uncharacterized protein n=1 Tax=Legionella micdadei TaxID=451 RepID=A0A098GES4_LEGMI|nr:hypothetical protein [Legionella micdadei]KTD27542.1 hypothetical protein Lmic_1862 [Legionella micdadei]CEG60969.1 protein of unknown function [Legionella micdadei]SCY69737.1 hypothetical protein SAMN02982997_02540 [Legionella micdadei]